MKIDLNPVKITIGARGVKVYEDGTIAMSALGDDVRFEVWADDRSVTLDNKGMQEALNALVALLNHPGKPHGPIECGKDWGKPR